MMPMCPAVFRMRRALRLALWVTCSCAALVPLASRAAPRSEPVEADRIVAVVNDEVITYNDLRQRLDFALAQLKNQGTPLPSRAELERQMLERLVMDRVSRIVAMSFCEPRS